MDVVADYKNDLNVEWPGNNISSPISAVQCCLKSGSGTVKYIFMNLALRLTKKSNPNYGE